MTGPLPLPETALPASDAPDAGRAHHVPVKGLAGTAPPPSSTTADPPPRGRGNSGGGAPTRVYGLDLSLTSTGIACSTGWVDRLRPPGRMVGYERLRWIRDSVLDFTDLDALVVVEGPSFGSRGNAVHQLGGLWWLITEALDRRGCLLAVASPQTRAKYATGRGNAGKDEVLAAAVRRFTAFMVVSNDEADALILCAMGCDRLGMPIAPMPAEHRKALNAVDWPEGVTT